MKLFKRFSSRRYWKSRQWSLLWKGLPGFICLGIGITALAAVRRPDSSSLATRYDAFAVQAHEESRDETEELCRRRLLVLQPSDPRTHFEYAIALEHQGQADKAVRIIQSLAPLNGGSYAPAQFWLAERTIEEKRALKPGEVEALQRRLELSLVGRDSLPKAHLPLVEIALKTRQWEVAIRHLEAVVPYRPDLLMTLAVAYRQEGKNESRALKFAEQAAEYFSNRVKENLQDDSSRLHCAEALVFQRKLKEAIGVLQLAPAIDTDPRYGSAIAQIFLLRMSGAGTVPITQELNAPADALEPANLPISTLELATKIELLEQALHFAPHNPAVLAAVAQLSLEKSPQGERARSFLKDVLARGNAPATVHLILGTAAATDGDMEQAVLHLEQAHQRDPRLAAAANNLAFVMARTDPPQLENALRLVNAALKVMPRHPEFRETRGQILILMGKPVEAIRDLEDVLKKLPGRREIHKSLASAYRAIGDVELANRHEQLAKALKVEKTEQE